MCEKNENKLTNLHKKLIAIIITLIIVCIILLILNFQPNETRRCDNSNCIKASASILKLIDNRTDPCDNFYNFVCGQFPQRATIDGFESIIQYQEFIINKTLKTYLLDDIDQNVDSGALQIQKQFYQACTNTTAIDQDDDRTFWNLIMKFGGWPVIVNNRWNENSFDLIELIVNLRQFGFYTDLFFTISIDSNQIAIDLPEKVDKITEINAEKYVDLLTNIAIEFGAFNYIAKAEMREMMHFQNRLAKLMDDMLDEKYENITIREIQNSYQKINWLEFLNKYTKDQLTEDDYVLFKLKNYLPKLDILFKQTRKRIQADYIVWKLIESNAPLLSTKIREKIANYRLQSNLELDLWYRDRDRYCYEKAKDFLPYTLEATYFQRQIDDLKLKKIEEIIRRIGKQMEKKLIKAEWIDEHTRKIALDKLRNIIYIIGGPQEMFNKSRFDQILGVDKIEMNTSNLMDIKNEIVAKGIDHIFLTRTITNNTNSRFYSNVATIDARFLRDDNILYIPAGILSLYNTHRPTFMNYAIIGTIIGHELTHAFDIVTTYNHKIWWTSGTTLNFKKTIKCLEETCNEGISDDQNIDCYQTLLENLADYTGINLSYEAYQSWVIENDEEPNLPGLKYTTNQLFWITYGTYMCHLPKFTTLYQHLQPSRRIIASFRNSKYFNVDFNCPVNSNMNPTKKCEIL